MFSKTSRSFTILTALVAVTVLALISIEASSQDQGPMTACRDVSTAAGGETSNAVSWVLPGASLGRAKLDEWCSTVGPALIRKPRKPHVPGGGRVFIVDWNVHVGNADVAGLIQQITAGERTAGREDPEFVLLLQEAFRRGGDVPRNIASGRGVPARISPGTEDIQALADRLDWWLFYAPSMRNGQSDGAPEDRGNAIMSTLPLDSPEAIELPFSVQRRVALAAEVHDDSRALRVRVLSVHFDTRAPLGGGFIFGASAARNRQAKWLAHVLKQQAVEIPLIVGGDLNSYWGPFESSIGTLSTVADPVDCGKAGTHTSGFTLDHIFARLPSSMAGLTCSRGVARFDSDHYPLVMSLPVSGIVD